MNESKLVVGIAWYRREQYELLRALAADPESLAKTYDEWLAGVTKTMDELGRLGVVGRKVDVEVNLLIDWCREKGTPLDGAARSTYAATHL